KRAPRTAWLDAAIPTETNAARRSTAMDVPIRFVDTERVTPDTHAIRQIPGEGMGPVPHYINSAVITGAEPVIVDCGPAITREGWLGRTFGLGDPLHGRRG